MKGTASPPARDEKEEEVEELLTFNESRGRLPLSPRDRVP